MGANEYNFDGYKFEVEDIVYVKDLVLKKRDFTQFLISGMAVLPNPSWSGDSYGGEWEAYIIRNRESDFIVVCESDLLSPNEAIKIFLSQSGISDKDIEWVSSGLQLNKRVKSWGSLTTK